MRQFSDDSNDSSSTGAFFTGLFAGAVIGAGLGLWFAPKSGIEKRVAWTTSRITGSPEPPLPYVTERAFPAIKFTQCLDLAAAPGSDRLFVVEQSGKIFSFANKPDVAAAELAVDFAQEIPGVQQVYALAFHPDFRRLMCQNIINATLSFHIIPAPIHASQLSGPISGLR